MRILALLAVAVLSVGAVGAAAWEGGECRAAQLDYLESVKELAVLSKEVGKVMKEWKAEYDHVQVAHEHMQAECQTVIIA